ncbi:MAG: hypothetical protein EHM21_10745, partial [Chloroflexi bacterium]
MRSTPPVCGNPKTAGFPLGEKLIPGTELPGAGVNDAGQLENGLLEREGCCEPGAGAADRAAGAGPGALAEGFGVPPRGRAGAPDETREAAGAAPF